MEAFPHLVLSLLAPALGAIAITFAVIDHRRAPEPGHGWFVAALAAFIFAAVPFHPFGFSYDTANNAYGWRLASAVIVLLPSFLLHVVAVICGSRDRRVLLASDLVGAATVLWLLAMPTFPGIEYEPRPWYFAPAFTAFGVHFVVALTISLVQLSLAARGGIGPARTRGVLLAVTLVTFGVSYLIWFASPGPIVELVMSILAGLAGLSFWAAVRAPRRLFELLAGDEHVDPSRAIVQLMQSTDVRRDLRDVLQSTILAWGLVGAAVRDAHGVVEVVGSSPVDSSAVRSSRSLVVEATIPGGISVEVTSMSLTPPLRGRDRDQLALLATYIQLAFEREEAAARERAAVRAGAAAAEALEDAQEQMRRADAAADRFLAIVARELREPASALLGLAHPTESAWEELPSEQLRPLQHLVARRVERIAATVEQLLLAASVEDGTLLRGRERCDVRELVRAAARDAEMLEPVEMACAPHDGCCTIRTDPLAVRHIVAGLVANAILHGGEPVQVAVEHRGAHVHVEVSDFGPGVRERFSPELFQRFTRDSDEHAPGVGLGLAIAQELAHAIEATLTYAREAERTIFRLSLPADVTP